MTCDDTVLAVCKVSGLGVFADLLDLSVSSSMHTKENTVSTLLNLVRCDDEDVVVNVRDSGSSKGRSKATELLRLLLGVSNEILL
ncbi:hypothetical protein Fmac_001693 [Flemingia macrophylla]|uniref:Uncharacterized protein n=1 Tax=Flemingia macrophylla TaxID=520843 RepID=A0ABD1NIM0_9FABA